MDPLRRRNSILKTDTDAATPTKTMTKNKRISFSGKNHVKEFGEGNENYTDWGPTYETQAHQKSDSAVSTQMDISVSVCETTSKAAAVPVSQQQPKQQAIASNKENLVPGKRNYFSFAFLDDENSDVSEAERSTLHAHPTDNISREANGAGDIFAVKSFVEVEASKKIHERRSSTTTATRTHNDTAMEVSMVWQDILAQTEKAGGMNKTGLKMGNTINLAEESVFRPIVVNKENGAIPKHRQTIHYQASDGQMDESIAQPPIIRPSVVVNRVGGTETIHFNANDGQMDESGVFKMPSAGPRQTMHFTKNDGAMDESIQRPNNQRQTIFYGSENGNLDVSVHHTRDQRQTIHYQGQEGDMQESFHSVKQNRQTIHFQDGEMDESTVKIQKHTRSIYYQPGEDDEMEVEEGPQKTPGKRGTIYYKPTEGHMDESTVTGHLQPREMENPPRSEKEIKSRQTVYYHEENAVMDESRVAKTKTPEQQRQTIYSQGGMDISVNENIPVTMKTPVAAEISGKQEPIRRQTVYYQEQDANLDVSCAAPQRKSAPPTGPLMKHRQTVYDHRGMDISLAGGEEINQPTVHLQQNVQSAPPPVVRRQTVYYQGKDAGLDESCADENPFQLPQRANVSTKPVTRSSRQTVYDHGGMDISLAGVENIPIGSKTPVTVAPSGPRRQTVYYKENEAALDVSCVAPEKKPAPPTGPLKRYRQTVYEQGGMDISLANNPTVANENVPTVAEIHGKQEPIRRQTVYYQEKDAGMDETQRGDLVSGPVASAAKIRHTVYDHGGMDMSTVGNENIPTVAEMYGNIIPAPAAFNENQVPIRRQTVYYQENDAGLDVSCVNEKRVVEEAQPEMESRARASKLRQTIYDHGGMDMSTVGNENAPVETAIPEPVMPPRRQTVYYQHGDDLDVSCAPLPPREMTRFAEDADAMEESLMTTTSVVLNQKSFAREIPQAPRPTRQTIYYNTPDQAAGMDESRKAPPPAIQEQSMMMMMEESPIIPNSRRGTFNVPPEQSRMQLNGTKGMIAEIESNVSDLNNSDLSIELMDSNCRAVPVSRGASQRMSLMPSPDLNNETVNELILNFNVTGQFASPRRDQRRDEGEEEKQEDGHEERNRQLIGNKSVVSRIPVAKTFRTPKKEKSEARFDLSTVDTVCRDAGGMLMEMPKSNFEEMDEEQVFRVKQKHDPRFSIPICSEHINSMNRQTMLDMNDVTEYEPQMEVEMEEEEGEQEKEVKCTKVEYKDQDSVVLPAVPFHRELDLKKFEGLDFEEGVKQLRMLRYMVDKVSNTTLVEESHYLPQSEEYVSLKQRIMGEIKEETERRKGMTEIDIDRGCFPLCLPMEDMIKNLVDSVHKNWRYQDLYYFMGLLKFKHRLVKTFQVVITFQLVDAEFEREHYLPFEKFQIIEEDLSKCSKLDQKMHKEVMRQMPISLVSLYGTSNELGRFLTDMDRICRKIFRETFSPERN